VEFHDAEGVGIGDEYREYMKRTPRIVPRVRFSRNTGDSSKVAKDEKNLSA
jgi:hypothetical protein